MVPRGAAGAEHAMGPNRACQSRMQKGQTGPTIAEQVAQTVCGRGMWRRQFAERAQRHALGTTHSRWTFNPTAEAPADPV